MTYDEFIEFVRGKEAIVCYGAALVGQYVQKSLKMNGIEVSAFTVTTVDDQTQVNGLPVIGIDEIYEIYPNAFILVTVGEQTQPDIIKNLKDRNIEEYFVIPEAFLYEMRAGVLAYDAKTFPNNTKKQADVLVGYLYPGHRNADYPEKRCIIDKIDEAEYVKMPKEIKKFPYSHYTAADCKNQKATFMEVEEACYFPQFYKPHVSWIHTFNTVCKTDLPWCSSFETALPRIWGGGVYETFKDYRNELAEYMMRPNCKALFPLCRNAYDIQKNHLKAFLPSEDVRLLMSKTKVLHPPQQLLVKQKDIEERARNLKKIEFIFIGYDFFRKGGKAMIDVLSRMEDKYDFHLTLISSIGDDDFFTHTPYEEMIKYKKIIQEKSWIEYYESLPNEAVLEKCKHAHVGLFPSVGDTYGYATLEMQAAGLPVVTTNIRAFPEINNNECGWICNVPCNELGFCSEKNLPRLYDILEAELERVFEDIFNNPEQIKTKGIKAWNRIKEMHDPYRYGQKIKEIMITN